MQGHVPCNGLLIRIVGWSCLSTTSLAVVVEPFFLFSFELEVADLSLEFVT